MKFLLILFLIGNTMIGQKRDSVHYLNKHYLSFEALGAGYAYSVNYENVGRISNKSAYYLRIGASFTPTSSYSNRGFFFFPAFSGVLIGGKKHMADIGIGLIYIKSIRPYNWPNYFPGYHYYPDHNVYYCLKLAYRYNFKRVFLSANFYPTYFPKYAGSYYYTTPNDEPKYWVLYGLTVGYKISK